jgi:predicted nucleic-acid-binding protein
MKIVVLDTTYVLPLFGIDIIIGESFKQNITKLWDTGVKRFDFYLPSVCLIETLYKLTAVYRKMKEKSVIKRYSVALPTVITNKHVNIINPYLQPEIVELALKISLANHKDLFDCLIGATALIKADILITEDKELNKKIHEEFTQYPIQIMDWKEFTKEWDPN